MSELDKYPAPWTCFGIERDRLMTKAGREILEPSASLAAKLSSELAAALAENARLREKLMNLNERSTTTDDRSPAMPFKETIDGFHHTTIRGPAGLMISVSGGLGLREHFTAVGLIMKASEEFDAAVEDGRFCDVPSEKQESRDAAKG